MSEKKAAPRSARVVIFDENDDPPPWSEYLQREAPGYEKAVELVRTLPNGGLHERRKLRELIVVTTQLAGREQRKRDSMIDAARRLAERIPKYGRHLDDADDITFLTTTAAMAEALVNRFSGRSTRAGGGTPPEYRKYIIDVTASGALDESGAILIADVCGIRYGRPTDR